MEAPSNAQQPHNNQVPNQSRSHQGQRGRRGGRGRGRGRGGDNAALNFRPSSVTPVPQPADQHTSGDERRTAGGNARRGRGRGRGGRPPETRTVNGRAFGGSLTQEESLSIQSSIQGQLQPSAPVFVPGNDHVVQVPVTKQQASHQHHHPHKRRASKSQAPDIATRTHEDIDNGHYECPICTNEVRRNSKVWSCHTCWTVFHLSCIKKWSSNQGASLTQQNIESDNPSPRQWRCPGCNLPKDVLPGSYTCWCEKETDPHPLAGIPPHSCGQSCGRERVRKCPHPCQLTCHAGPCPPCSHMGPTKSCFCGRHQTTKRCSETDYESGWTCGEVCGVVMPCGEHTCERLCHDGDCGPCEVRLPARCYCGQTEKDVLCSDRGTPTDCHRSHIPEDGEPVVEDWIGVFDCNTICNRPFDCGVHFCKKQCHPQDADPGHCPQSPDLVTHCACGKTSVKELTETPRTSCEDPIPICDKPCDKLLLCGHKCPQVCHSGDCPSCMQTTNLDCRCGRVTSKTICHQGNEEQPQCMRICRVSMNCGRHACEEHCCPGERKALERQSIKRKQRPLGTTTRNAADFFEAEHICTRQCGRPLKCGNHICSELCHKGPCNSCREAIFEEVSCNCGRTVLQPPLPCGTQPPPCRYPCERPKTCGHPQVAHNCHQDSEACPKCPFLVEKRCMCGKKALKNQQCWLMDVRCGEICGRKLKCGSHFCRKPCHRPGECEDANGQPCQQPCGKEKKVCGHPDEAPCHAPYPCKEEKACTSKIFITCPCQAQKQEVKCGATRTSEGNAGKSLSCNEECARLERNRKLALALNIDQAAHVDGGDHIPYSTETLNLFAASMKWAQTQEREFRVFATSQDEKRLRFKPMQAQQRSFVHALADDFGLDSESVDPEPHRHVIIWKTPRFVSAPNKTLADALRIRRTAQRSINTSANASDNESGSIKPKPKVAQPFNGFVITKPRFGLTIDEVRTELNSVVHPISPFTFDVEFLPSEEVVLKATSRTLSAEDLETLLKGLKVPLATAIASKGYGTTQLCSTDSSLNITRLESDVTNGDGWSRVAAKKAAPRTDVQTATVGGSNSFALLSGSKITFTKKKTLKPKVKPEAVVDDWEAAELAEEEKEKVGTASSEEEEDVVLPTEASQVLPDLEGGQDKRQDATEELQPADALELNQPDAISKVEQASA